MIFLLPKRFTSITLGFSVGLFLSFFGITLVPIAHAQVFTDMTGNALYDPYITQFAQQGFISGYKDLAGKTGKFGPENELQRDQMAKISASVRLAEQKGIVQQWFTQSESQLSTTVLDALKAYRSCAGGACANIGGIPFPDVPEKALDCELNNSGCHPWFTEFVYFAVNQGYIQGFETNKGPEFRPGEQMIRSHTMKLVMAASGHVEPQEDLRFQRLVFLADQKGYYSPICLGDATAPMMDNGNDAKLIAYTLLADQLRLFGGNCEVFTEEGKHTPKERADFMQRNIKRKEAVRYFGMTTSYTPLYDLSFASQSPNAPLSEPWMEMSLKELLEENEDSFVNEWLEEQEGSLGLDEGVDELDELEEALKKIEEVFGELEDDPLLKVEKLIQICDAEGNCVRLEPGEVLEKGEIKLNQQGEPEQDVFYKGQTFIVSCYEFETKECTQALKNKIDAQWEETRSIDQMAQLSKEGRCCDTQSTGGGQCKTIHYTDYQLASTPDRYMNGQVWYQASNGTSDDCWVPFKDILNGLPSAEELAQEQKELPKQEEEEVCSITPLQNNLVMRYQMTNYKYVLREIWLSSWSTELKMYMQIGLDLAIKKSDLLSPMLREQEPDCEWFNREFKYLVSGHAAATLRLLPSINTQLLKAEDLLDPSYVEPVEVVEPSNPKPLEYKRPVWINPDGSVNQESYDRIQKAMSSRRGKIGSY